MSIKKKFYVYVHRYASGPRWGQVFYVGKGDGRRAFVKTGRNIKWSRIVSKYGYHVDICQKEMTEFDAFTLEMWLIAKYRNNGFDLANMTDGGEGASGCIRSAETRKKIGDKNRGNKHTDETKSSIRAALLGRKYNEGTIEKMSAAKRGVRKTRSHIEAVIKANSKPVINDAGEIFESIKEAAEYIRETVNPKAQSSMITKCCKGKKKTAYGHTWRYHARAATE